MTINKNKQEDIRQRFLDGANVSEISRELGIDRKTVLKYIPDENQKHEQQDAFQFPSGEELTQPVLSQEVLDEAKKIVKKQNAKKITDEFWHNTCLPYINENYISKEEHQKEINELKQNYENKLGISADYSLNQIKDLDISLQNVTQQRDYANYIINNSLNGEMKRQGDACFNQQCQLDQDIDSYNEHIRRMDKRKMEWYLDLSKKEEMQDIREKQQDKRKKEQDEREKRLNKLTTMIKEKTQKLQDQELELFRKSLPS